ncbi:MAG: TatD family hydrolase [Anaerolineales bacterium]|nr:MAG: TatD family hydrolase [Anaerolineales bacterium]
MWIDAHAHLDLYGDALEAVLAEIEQHHIFTVSNSMDLESHQRNLRIAEASDWVLPIFGVHPWKAPEHIHHLDDLSDAVEQSPMLGEIGLDHHFVEDASQYPAQRTVFDFLLAAAKEQGKVVNLHTKGAEREVLHLLEAYDIQRAIVHWYSGTLDVFHELLARGTLFTVGVELLYSKHIQTIARELPWEHLLTETDNPGGPRSLIGGPGMPLLIRDVLQALAELRNTAMETIVQTVEHNFARLISDDPWQSETYDKLWPGQQRGKRL